MICGELFSKILYFIKLTVAGDILWTILPLLFTTILMVVYFQKYKDEWFGWNTLVANSLILLFVGMNLLKYVYGLDDGGVTNFLTYYWKFVFSVFIIFFGSIIASLNFSHYFSKEISAWISSPVTVNLIAYLVMLIVYSNISYDFLSIISLFIWFFFLAVFFQIIKILANLFFVRLKKVKEKEEIDQIKQDKKPLRERKKQIKKIEKVIKKEEKEVVKEEKEVVKGVLKKLDDQKKTGRKLKKALKK